MGMKTAISDMLMENTVKPISLRALQRRREGASSPVPGGAKCSPSPRWASSTTNPVEIVRAINESCRGYSRADTSQRNVPISETGTATLGISVARGSAER